MKLHIFGASGSGVTTLGKAFALERHLSYLDSDDFFGRNQNLLSVLSTTLMKEICESKLKWIGMAIILSVTRLSIGVIMFSRILI